MNKIVTGCLIFAVMPFALLAQDLLQGKKQLVDVMEQNKDAKDKKHWVGNTGLYFEYEKTKTSGDYSPFLAGNFRRAQSHFSFEYHLMKTYEIDNENYERSQMLGGVRYNHANDNDPYSFGAALAYRDEITVQTAGSSSGGENIKSYRPNLFAEYRFENGLSLYYDFLFSYERRVSHGDGEVNRYNDYVHELLAGGSYKVTDHQTVALEAFHVIEDYKASDKYSELQARIKYTYAFESGLSLTPYIRYGVDMKYEKYTDKYHKVHTYDADRIHYGMSLKYKYDKRVTVTGNYYFREESWNGLETNKDVNKHKHYALFGVNYAY